MSAHELMALLHDAPPEGASPWLFAIKTRTGREMLMCRTDVKSRILSRNNLDLEYRSFLDTIEGATLLHRHVKVVSYEPFKWEPAA